jgi:hypothetical protein
LQNEITFGTILFFGALFVLGLARGGLEFWINLDQGSMLEVLGFLQSTLTAGY